jgi:hypothetical protein
VAIELTAECVRCRLVLRLIGLLEPMHAYLK